jgi:uncharacterized protein YdaU (DUF1376 family)
MDYYKRYMGDYGRDTSRLSMIEHGAYSLLLDDYYSTRSPLPADLDALYRVCRAMTKQEQAAVKSVANHFFPVGQDGLRHSKRADEEIAKWEELTKEASESGKRGAEARWGKTRDKKIADPMRTPSNPHGEPHADPNADPIREAYGGKDGGKNGSPAPIPNPKPEARSHSHVQERAREGANGSVVSDPEGVLVDSLPYEQAIQATFPKGRNASNWGLAIHNAHQLVGRQLATWPELEEATERYARYFAANGGDANHGAHNFFDPQKQLWSQPWDPPRTKGQLRQDANLDAGLQWLAESGDT